MPHVFWLGPGMAGASQNLNTLLGYDIAVQFLLSYIRYVYGGYTACALNLNTLRLTSSILIYYYPLYPSIARANTMTTKQARLTSRLSKGSSPPTRGESSLGCLPLFFQLSLFFKSQMILGNQAYTL